MKKTLLLTFLLATSGLFAQNFNSGELTLLTGYTAEISISGITGMTTVTLKAPDNVWFAIGFGGLNMSAGADVLRTDGTTIVDARSTGQFLPPADASQDWVIESNTTSGGTRTLVVSRANNTGDPDDFIFTAAEGAIQLIYAHGTSTTYAYHGGANRGFTTIGVLSSREENAPLEFKMFPNPSTDIVNIQLANGTTEAQASIYDYQGRQISTKKVTSNDPQLNVNNLAAGVYLVRVVSNNKVGVQRFVKE